MDQNEMCSAFISLAGGSLVRNFQHRKYTPLSNGHSVREKRAPTQAHLHESVKQKPIIPIEDQGVPEEHKGLHESLYGDGDASLVHGAGTRSVSKEMKPFNNDGTTNFSVDEFLKRLEQAPKTAGVYRVIDAQGITMYVGMSRDVALSVRAHRTKQGDEAVSSVNLRTFAFPSRARLERVRDEWLSALDYNPVGNKLGWDATSASATDVMTYEQRKKFESTKKKLRQAMADPTLYDEEPKIEPGLNSDHMRSAVEAGDWSAEIEGQTQETHENKQKQMPVMVSPFENSTTNRNSSGESQLPLTVENADTVLESVRPMLQADGGNVQVIGVKNGVVSVRLVGACGTCSAASTTLRLGIESALKDAFGEKLVEVLELGKLEARPLSPAVVDEVLDAEVRTPVAALGGQVNVISACNGAVALKYVGPESLAYGVELVVRQKVPGVREVTFVK